MEKEIIKQTEQNETPDNRRTVFIGAKVSPRQKEHIKSLAEQCGMTVSDYLLARAYNYKPKARLSKEEAALLQNLDNCRADLVKYTSECKPTAYDVQPDSIYGELAEGAWQCGRKCLPVPKFRKRTEQYSNQ